MASANTMDELLAEPFWASQEELVQSKRRLEGAGFAPVVYGKPTLMEAFYRPTDDIMKTFLGPFKGLMQSRAVRLVEQRTVEKHNRKALDVAVRWFVLDDTFDGTRLDWLGDDLKEHIARFAFSLKPNGQSYTRELYILEPTVGPYMCGLWPLTMLFDVRVAGSLDGWCIDEDEARHAYGHTYYNANLVNPVFTPRDWPELAVQDGSSSVGACYLDKARAAMTNASTLIKVLKAERHNNDEALVGGFIGRPRQTAGLVNKHVKQHPLAMLTETIEALSELKLQVQNSFIEDI